ncbi:Myb/SANT-like DNA-binding domain-containing protein 3 [Frankliniella fusca]|uniref:Regulatory protein zeste n=1 Tax=Frankliniella fusca TaxID=407009 RepID=A0AAE1H1R5_9NEOP|nr:Myb/SANT-like DNA-binding domain-containing protein 3 [Frankliniella fusca]
MARGGGSTRKSPRDPEEKRERTVNFTENEKDLLVSIVFEFRQVLESKVTDSATVKEKNETWELAATAFNSRSGFTPRTSKSLRVLWGNLKGLARAAAATQKSELFKTGGGSIKARDLTPREFQILDIIGVSGTGLENYYDGDSSAWQLQVQQEEHPGGDASAAECTGPTDTLGGETIILDFAEGEVANISYFFAAEFPKHTGASHYSKDDEPSQLDVTCTEAPVHEQAERPEDLFAIHQQAHGGKLDWDFCAQRLHAFQQVKIASFAPVLNSRNVNLNHISCFNDNGHRAGGPATLVGDAVGEVQLWLQRLPAMPRAVVAGSPALKLDAAAALADTVSEAATPI